MHSEIIAWPCCHSTEDVLASGASLAHRQRARLVFVVHGEITIAGRDFATARPGTVLQRSRLPPAPPARPCGAGSSPHDAAAGSAGAAGGDGVASREKLTAGLDTLPPGELLLRGDSVGFPPGGCAYLHRHQGPGIRCLVEGGMRIDTHGRSTSYGPGGAWYESGPEPVFAQAAADRPSRFIRVMILPRALIGKSSIQYVNEADKDKPRVQQYRIFADAPIARPAG